METGSFDPDSLPPPPFRPLSEEKLILLNHYKDILQALCSLGGYPYYITAEEKAYSPGYAGDPRPLIDEITRILIFANIIIERKLRITNLLDEEGVILSAQLFIDYMVRSGYRQKPLIIDRSVPEEPYWNVGPYYFPDSPNAWNYRELGFLIPNRRAQHNPPLPRPTAPPLPANRAPAGITNADGSINWEEARNAEKRIRERLLAETNGTFDPKWECPTCLQDFTEGDGVHSYACHARTGDGKLFCHRVCENCIKQYRNTNASRPTGNASCPVCRGETMLLACERCERIL